MNKKKLKESLNNLKDISDETNIYLLVYTADKKNIYPIEISRIEANKKEIYILTKQPCGVIENL